MFSFYNNCSYQIFALAVEQIQRSTGPKSLQIVFGGNFSATIMLASERQSWTSLDSSVVKLKKLCQSNICLCMFSLSLSVSLWLSLSLSVSLCFSLTLSVSLYLSESSSRSYNLLVDNCMQIFLQIEQSVIWKTESKLVWTKFISTFHCYLNVIPVWVVAFNKAFGQFLITSQYSLIRGWSCFYFIYLSLIILMLCWINLTDA